MNTETDIPDDDIGCIEAINGLYAYIDGELDDPKALAAIEDHLGHCRHCYSRIELEKALTERLKKSARDHAPAKLQKRMRDLMDRF